MNNAAEKKGADRLDTRSTDALHWAECFCEQIGADKDMVDDLMPWFANYWAAVNDPLQNKIDLLRNELEIAHGKSLAVSESFAHLESTTYPRDLVDQLIDECLLRNESDIEDEHGTVCIICGEQSGSIDLAEFTHASDCPIAQLQGDSHETS
jgi:hypothetical protein